MKCVFTSPDSTEVALLKGVLEQSGIRCSETNEQLSQIIPVAPFQAELWVLNDDECSAAEALIADWQHPVILRGRDWVCRRCGEQSGSQFDECWKCGAVREPLA